MTAVPSHGHTPGHTAYLIASGNHQLMIWGDTVHVPEVQTAIPEAGMGFDTDLAMAAASRKRMFDRVSADGTLVAGMHLHFPGFARLARRGEAYALYPEAWVHSFDSGDRDRKRRGDDFGQVFAQCRAAAQISLSRSFHLHPEMMMSFDLVLRGGRVVDPSQKLDAVTDVAFSGGKVAAVGNALKADPGTEVRDVSGYIVTPGLIDLHTHVYWGGTSLGIDAEEFCRTSGVTTAIDTGSAGPGNFAGFRKHVIEPSQVRILAYLHVSHAGIYGFSHRVMVGESEEMRLMNPIDAVQVADANRDLIVGIKVRVGRHSSGTSGIVPLQIALEVANEVGMPLMVPYRPSAAEL